MLMGLRRRQLGASRAIRPLVRRLCRRRAPRLATLSVHGPSARRARGLRALVLCTHACRLAPVVVARCCACARCVNRAPKLGRVNVAKASAAAIGSAAAAAACDVVHAREWERRGRVAGGAVHAGHAVRAHGCAVRAHDHAVRAQGHAVRAHCRAWRAARCQCARGTHGRGRHTMWRGTKHRAGRAAPHGKPSIGMLRRRARDAGAGVRQRRGQHQARSGRQPCKARSRGQVGRHVLWNALHWRDGKVRAARRRRR
eukprot:354064-Chlamydomonas_euryale.AAC.12